MKAYLLGRAARPEYWIWIVCITLGSMAATLILRDPTLVSGLSFIPWAVIAARRLRDFGWSPWWCVSTLAGGFIVGFVSGVVNVFATTNGGTPLLTPPMLMIAYGLVNWGVIIFIGSRKSVAPGVGRHVAGADAALLRTFD